MLSGAWKLVTRRQGRRGSPRVVRPREEFVLEGVDVGGILTYVLVKHSNLMGKIR